MRKAIFFDRDGTLIQDKIYLNDPDNIEYLPGVVEALKTLRDLGFLFIVVTNQSGMAKGIVQIENLNKIHQKMTAFFASHGLDVSRYYYAPYNTDTNHRMRKPNPGMLETAKNDHNLDLRESWMIGDRWSDIAAGQTLGLKTIFLLGSEDPKSLKVTPNAIVSNLKDVADHISLGNARF
ncbi:MAG: HAD family hydrolase [Bdellovibrionales bacterium]|nr:HAD family hydrolase [Bdellovibrionales bacterium]